MKQFMLLMAAIIILASCDKEQQQCPGSTEKVFSLTDFKNINAAENFAVSVTKGEAFSVKARGCSADLNDMEVSIKQGGLLDVRFTRFKNDRHRVDLEVTMPELRFITLAGASRGKISGFGNQNATVTATLGGTAKCEINPAPRILLFALSGTSELTVAGTTDQLKGTVGGAAILSAYYVTAKQVEVQTGGTATAYVIPVERLKATAAGASRIYYRGTPPYYEALEAGTAKVVREG